MKYSDGNIFEPSWGWDSVKGNKAMKQIPKNVAFMWYNRMKVFQMSQEEAINCPYDFYISTRIDMLFRMKVKYDYFDMSVEKSILYIPEGADYSGYQDKIAMGNQFAMAKYCSLYHHLPEYIKKYSINPEPLLKKHLTNYPIHRIGMAIHKIHPKICQKQKIKNYVG
jgi:hypothetical protein